ncbi:glycosyltransferase 1 domain-containing protein 1-like [Asterias rubens]|uniref:glycosyltransferase 1 domain-containing protein 1-like n=1 Tax=Asterias rubens TaxID=7604 RepID=UPI0014552466|nr:glycosyltransferase 1 domain-containing protein 1-like [Asterias rubens]XP_033628471.1 glycosyltransferase 1 domain-containing protein 1-like [Asterias rubens]
MKVLVLSALRAHTGNFSSAHRISDFFKQDGIESELVDSNGFSSGVDFNHHVVMTAADCVLAIHAYRSGRLLLECPVPYGIVFGGTDINEYPKNHEKLRTMTAVIMKARFLVSFNQAMRDQAVTLWPDIGSRLYTQPQGVVTSPSSHFDFHLHLRDACGIPDHSKIFLLVAGMRPVKDPLYLAHRFSEWHNENRSIYLVIMGPCLDNQFAEKVKVTAKRLPGVEMIEPLAQDDCHKAMQECTAVVNSSLSEGMSTAILEAMDLCVPVIARNIPGNRTLVEHRQTGLLYDTPQEFIFLAKDLLMNPEQRSVITAKAKQLVESCHSAQAERFMYTGLIKKMLP